MCKFAKIFYNIMKLFSAIRKDYIFVWVLWCSLLLPESVWATDIAGRMAGVSVASEIMVTVAPILNVPHGIYDEPFTLDITCDDPVAKIYYTTDGTVPSVTNGTLYRSPLQVSGNTVLRAVSVNDTLVPSEVVTATYLFLNDVLRQSNTPKGYPAEWGEYAVQSGIAKADYEMDPEMTSDPHFCELVKEGLRSLPIVSLVTDPAHFFNKVEDAQVGGIYIYTGAPVGSGVGRGWERPVSFELFDAQGNYDLQINCGVKIHGGHSRLPEKSPKHSLRLVFRDEYGPGKLRYPLFGVDEPSKFNAVVLRSAFCNSWHHQDKNQRERAVYSRDMWAKSTQKEMGHLTTNGIYAHLFINGLYWGLYNPTERVDDDFCDVHLGGKKEDYDVIKVEEYGGKHVVTADAGSVDKWHELFALAESALDMATYYRMQGLDVNGNRDLSIECLLDVENFVDYMLINYYGANSDWDSHNWLVVRNRVKADEGFHFICWDTEHILKELTDNRLGITTYLGPTELFNKLMKNPLFKRYFIDRVQKHCFDKGVLTPMRNADRWLRLDAIIDTALYCEQARWGDYRRDVHKYANELYTKENHYDAQRRYLLGTYFPKRTDTFVSQLQNKGWFPTLPAPVILYEGKSAVGVEGLDSNEGVTLTGSGTLYYTIDGEAPVLWNENSSGVRSASAIRYNGELITSSKAFTLKVVAYDGGEWSAVREQHFEVCGTTSIKDVSDKIKLDFQYNASGYPVITYTLPFETIVDLAVYDMQGKQMLLLHDKCVVPGGLHTIELPSDLLLSGTYVCRLICDGYTCTAKIMIR